MSMPLIGEVVLVKDAWDGPDGGYLNVKKGERLEVLYVGHEIEEENWLYAKLMSSDEAIQGWIPMEKVETCRNVDDTVLAAMSSASDAALQYLKGESLKVKQWGRPENMDEADQIFVENATGQTGWIPITAVEQVRSKANETTEVVRVWRQVLHQQDLFSFPDSREEKLAGYAVYEKTQMSLPAGLVVEVLEKKEDWTKVLLRQHICGWMKSDNLSSEILNEAPPAPPPVAKVPPPKPNRPAPRSKVLNGSDKKADKENFSTEAPPPPPPPPSKEVTASPIRATDKRPERPEASPKLSPSEAKVIVEENLHGTVHLATFGLECLDGELADRCHELGGGAGAHIPDYEIAEALHRKKFPSDVILDARMFPDPDAALLTRHSGRHHLIIARICQHRNFRWWLQDAKIQYQKVLQRCERRGVQTPKISIAVYCRRGKHRSVAAACILRHIFQCEGYHCPELQHLSYAHWRNCCKMQCAECLHPPDELQVQLQHVYKQWCDLR